MATISLSEQDWQVRLFIYTFFVENARPPSYLETAAHFRLEAQQAKAIYQRLHAAHTIFLNPGSDDIRIANPLSAVPTDYLVHINGKQLWANCAWDSLGIPAMLGADATIEAKLPVSGEIVTYAIKNGELEAQDAIVHFPLPFIRWYDDLVYT